MHIRDFENVVVANSVQWFTEWLVYESAPGIRNKKILSLFQWLRGPNNYYWIYSASEIDFWFWTPEIWPLNHVYVGVLNLYNPNLTPTGQYLDISGKIRRSSDVTWQYKCVWSMWNVCSCIRNKLRNVGVFYVHLWLCNLVHELDGAISVQITL